MRVIKTNKDYEEVLREVEALVSLDPERGTADADRLELLAVLVQDYEKKYLEEAKRNVVHFVEEDPNDRRKIVLACGSSDPAPVMTGGLESMTCDACRCVLMRREIDRLDLRIIQTINARWKLIASSLAKFPRDPEREAEILERVRRLNETPYDLEETWKMFFEKRIERSN